MILFLVLISLPLLTVLLVRYVSPCAERAMAGTGQTDERSVILKQGCYFGLLLGTFFMVQNLFGNVIPLPAAWEPVVDGVFAPFILGCSSGRLFRQRLPRIVFNRPASGRIARGISDRRF